jgi:hypothetical protein
MECPSYLPPTAKVDKLHFKECLIELLQVGVPVLYRTSRVSTSVPDPDLHGSAFNWSPGSGSAFGNADPDPDPGGLKRAKMKKKRSKKPDN